jgi:hypothetical protein
MGLRTWVFGPTYGRGKRVALESSSSGKARQFIQALLGEDTERDLNRRVSTRGRVDDRRWLAGAPFEVAFPKPR